ncbi:mitochondrial peripheral inner membrane protein [Myotisia sp. PD_48]|nr:mitochondrial peripheral inner membrane protein [Myotisia sp. PD_48]
MSGVFSRYPHGGSVILIVRQCTSLSRFGTQSRRNIQQHSSPTGSPTTPKPPKTESRTGGKRWLPVAFVTAAAGGIGAYFRYSEDPNIIGLNPTTFTQYELVSKVPVSSTSSIFSLRPTRRSINAEVYQDAWETGIWSVQFKQPQLQVGRDYTPLPPTTRLFDPTGNSTESDDILQFLIRKDPHGEVSTYLHSLEPGSIIEMRGPQIEYELSPDIDDVLFIAGGTGVAPALQAVHTIFKCNGAKEMTRMHVLWANRRREDCLGGQSDNPQFSGLVKSGWIRFLPFIFSKETPLEPISGDDDLKNFTVNELEKLKKLYPGKLTVDYFVDEEKNLIGKDSIMNFIRSRNQPSPDKPRKRKLILISGPDGFISYLAGPKTWKDGYETQGPLLGLLRELNPPGWSVWKL